MSNRKMLVISALIGLRILGAIARSLLGTGIPESYLILKKFVGEFVLSVIAPLRWQLVACGLFVSTKSPGVSPWVQ